MPGIYSSARLSDFQSDEVDALLDWYNHGFSSQDDGKDHGRCGLWVFGPRCYGSSTIAWFALQQIERHDMVVECVPALSLCQLIREYWRLRSISQSHPDDYGLHMEYTDVEATLERLLYPGQFQVDGLMIDDLHEAWFDKDFWLRHVHPHLERRVKEGLATIIASDMAPASPLLLGVQRVIESNFVVCRAVVPVENRRRGTR